MTTSATPAAAKAGWRESNWLAAMEFGIVAALFIADVYRLIPISKTSFLFALGWLSLRLRGAAWGSVGLARPQSWRSAPWIFSLFLMAIVFGAGHVDQVLPG